MPGNTTSSNAPTVIVLASGRGERFVASGGSGSKLKALLLNKPVLDHTLEAVRASGLPWHLEDAGHAGMGDSIGAGVRATPNGIGWLILPADLPLIQSDTLLQVAEALSSGAAAAQPVYQGQRGHPVGFGAASGPALAALSGPQGAHTSSCVTPTKSPYGELDDVHWMMRPRALYRRPAPSRT